MKIAAVLTYPGHFLMTLLCLRSIRQHYPEIEKIYVLYDDMASAWPDYATDCAQHYHHTELVPYSSLPGIDKCDVGWWRAQLVKLHVDMILPEDQWFVVDGDVIFDEHCDVANVTPYSPWIDQRDNVLDQMVTRYVEHMLGQSDCRLTVDDYDLIITSIIPFRWLDRDQLQSLRQHVCHTHKTHSMVDYHCELFRTQGIVGFVPEGDKMVMHEWELIEAWNHLYRPGRYRLVMTGSGYQINQDTADCISPRFRHNSTKDREIGLTWFAQQDIKVTDDLWAKIINA